MATRIVSISRISWHFWLMPNFLCRNITSDMENRILADTAPDLTFKVTHKVKGWGRLDLAGTEARDHCSYQNKLPTKS